MRKCRLCGADITPERAEIYDHCSSSDCVTAWRRERLEAYRLDLVPKVGFAISLANDKAAASMGRSSGRT